MKKLHLTLIVLFMLCAVQAQKITETDLLGKWKIQATIMHGVELNFVTKKATVLKGFEDKYTKEQLDVLESAISAEHPFPVAFTFLKGGKVDVEAEGKTETESYTFIAMDGKYYIKVDRDEMGVSIVNAALHLILTDEGDEIEMFFKR